MEGYTYQFPAVRGGPILRPPSDKKFQDPWALLIVDSASFIAAGGSVVSSEHPV